jgi:GT2 family glycosyltransferase
VILQYHKVFPDSPTRWWVCVDAFWRQMQELRGRAVVRLDDYDPADPSQVVLTFDGAYANVLRYAVPILEELGYPFEVFVCSDRIGSRAPAAEDEPPASVATRGELGEFVARGGRLQWHTRSHPRLRGASDRSSLVRELEVPEELRRIDPAGFTFLAYPYGECDEGVREETRRRFRGAVALDRGDDRDPYALGRVTATNATRLASASLAVVIPSYNYGCFLAEAVESVVRQTIGPDEVLIADDCSTDGTERLGRELQERFAPLVRYTRNDERLGIVANFNRALGQTTSEYLCLLGADNRFRSDYLQKTRAALDVDEGLGVAYTDCALFGPRAELEWLTFPEEWRGPHKSGFFVVRFPEFDAASRTTFLRHRNFMHGSSLFRRAAFEQVGGYLPETEAPEDHDLFRRMVRRGWGARRVGEPLLEYRQHSREQANQRYVSHAELAILRSILNRRSVRAARACGRLVRRVLWFV